MEFMRKKELVSLLNLSFEEKIKVSKEFIEDWYAVSNGMIFVSFSGGKDSTALLHLCRQLYHDIPAVYLETGIEYPEIDNFVKSTENVVCLKPSMSYEEVTGAYGYSIFTRKISDAVEIYQNSKKNEYDLAEFKNKVGENYFYLKDIPCKVSNKCCLTIKEEPLNRYKEQTNRKAIVGILAEESMGRMRSFMLDGINQYNNSISYPIAFWREAEVKQYLKENNVPYCHIYGDLETYGEKRTMCMYCMRGVHLEESPNRFERMKEHNNDKYNYFVKTLGMSEVLNFLNVKI